MGDEARLHRGSDNAVRRGARRATENHDYVREHQHLQGKSPDGVLGRDGVLFSFLIYREAVTH